jgi:UDP-glucose 4-epimerase
LNLGTGRGYSVREILEAIASETGRDVPHVVKPRRAGATPKRRLQKNNLSLKVIRYNLAFSLLLNATTI